MIESNKDYSCKATFFFFFFKETGGLDFQIFLPRVDFLFCSSVNHIKCK